MTTSETGAEQCAPARDSAPLRSAATVLGTLVVVVAEFVLLMAVYLHGQSATSARLAAQRLAGQAQAAGTGRGLSQLATGTSNAIPLFARHGASHGSLSGLSAAATRAAARPDDETNLKDLRRAIGRVSSSFGHRQRVLNEQAAAIFAGLLILASIGWMRWFRKLIARERALQGRISEQQARSVSEQRLAALVRNAADLVVVCGLDSTVIFATTSSAKILGIDAAELIDTRFVDLVVGDGPDRFLRALAGDRREDHQLSIRLRHANGHIIDVEGNVTNLINDPSVGGMVLNVRDVTERLQLQEQVSRQAFHDSLSGLANRQLFADRLSHALERRSGGDQILVVLMCDLDDFKNINDSLGHGIGDEVLAIMGERVRSVIRAGDTAARLGGDEFAILMEATDLAGAELVAQRLLEVISEPLVLGDTLLTLNASIGLAQAIPGEMTSEDALRNVDVAMYLAKDRGKSGIAVYESRLHAEALERLELRAELQAALRNGEGLVLYYQPTVDMQSFDVVGFEALIRWVHPTKGFLPPGLFIPMAEESGLIAPLGSWVLREACAAAAAMTVPAGSALPGMAVNVAAQQLAQPHFVDEVVAALTESGLESRRLTLEITEGVILQDLDSIAPRLVALRNLGVRIAIDDFGTGYSSLAYLSHLPVDILKVDKSFVDRVTLDQQDASVTEAIITMGKTMKMCIVAEGVEQIEQASWLQSVNCDIGQGFLWSRPVPFAEAAQLAGVVIEVDGLPVGPSATVTVIGTELAKRLTS